MQIFLLNRGLLLILVVCLLFLVQVRLSDSPIISGRQLGCIESGFEKTNYSTYISRAFFIIAVLYVLFDIELILLLPRLFILGGQAHVYFSLLILLGIIVGTLLLEWIWSGLKWSLLVLSVLTSGCGPENENTFNKTYPEGRLAREQFRKQFPYKEKTYSTLQLCLISFVP